MRCDYDIIAAEYDSLMQFIPYDVWTKYIVDLYLKHKGRGKYCVDLGCGTGNISIPLSGYMFNVFAVDSSINMLFELQKKRDISRVFPINGDITDIKIKPFINLAVSMYDTVNHLTKEGFKGFMKSACSMLDDCGILMFDFNTKRGLQNFAGASFSRKASNFKSVWHAALDENSEICTLNLEIEGENLNSKTIFQERVVTVEEVFYNAEESGFKECSVYEFLSEELADEFTDRGMAVCKKK